MFNKSKGLIPTRLAMGLLGACLVAEAGAGILLWPHAAQARGAQSAVCQDALIDRMYNEAGRVPNGSGLTGECNPRNYGSNWSSYEELKSRFAPYFRTYPSTGYTSNGSVGVNGPTSCRDSVLTSTIVAYKTGPTAPGSISANLNKVHPNGFAEQGECNMYLWGGGNWNGNADLKNKVQTGIQTLRNMGYFISASNLLIRSSDQQPVGPVFAGPANAIAVVVTVGGVPTVKEVAADGYQPEGRFIRAATASERSHFRVVSLNNGSYIAIPQ